MLRAIEGGQHAVAIQFAEGAFFELGPSMSHGSTGDWFKELTLGQIIEKLVQMALDRLDGLLQEKKHQQGESQLALAGKVLRPHAMARQEVGIAQLSAQSFDQGDEVMGNVMNSSLHPHGNGGTAEQVQAKSFIISMLQLIQRVCGVALAAIQGLNQKLDERDAEIQALNGKAHPLKRD
jgi:hypothetical protein